jgi:hypothetical protein
MTPPKHRGKRERETEQRDDVPAWPFGDVGPGSGRHRPYGYFRTVRLGPLFLVSFACGVVLTVVIIVGEILFG